MTVAANLAGRLADAIGAKRVVSAAEELATYEIDGMVPSTIVRPCSAEEAAEAIRLAASEKLAVLPVGSRSKCELGMSLARYDIAMDMTGLRSVAHFDAGDLTLSVDAGMPLRELEAYLNQKGQFLPLAVPCFESTTVGGAVASGIDSALRLQYGSARDFLIGAEFIDGTGQICKSGGRVVKNVTGYDLHKLLIGSLGTLGAITRLNFRTFPLPAASGGHVAGFARSETALAYRRAVGKSGLPLSNLEVLSSGVVEMIRAILRRSGENVPTEWGHTNWSVYSCFEGDEEVVRRIGAELEKIGRDTGAAFHRILGMTEDESLGGMLRESFEWLRWASPANVICRVILPGLKAEVLTELLRLAELAALRAVLLVRAAGIVYFALLAEAGDESAMESLRKVVVGVRALAEAENGIATLLHAPLGVKQGTEQIRTTGAESALQRRVKQAFDPSNIFAPGRVVGGI